MKKNRSEEFDSFEINSAKLVSVFFAFQINRFITVWISTVAKTAVVGECVIQYRTWQTPYKCVDCTDSPDTNSHKRNLLFSFVYIYSSTSPINIGRKSRTTQKKWATIRLQFLFCSEKIWFNCFDLVVSQPKINDAIQCIEPSATKTVYGIRLHPYNFLRDNKEHRSTERRFMLDPFWKESNLPNHHRSQTKSWNLRLW